MRGVADAAHAVNPATPIFGAPTGLRLFLENYDDDRLPPVDATERAELEKHGPGTLEHATQMATEALRQFEGADGFDAAMSAHIVLAIK